MSSVSSSPVSLSRDQLVREFNSAFLVRRSTLVIKVSSEFHWEVPMQKVLEAVAIVVGKGPESLFTAVYADPARRGNIPWLVTFLGANSAQIWDEIAASAVKVDAGVPGLHPAQVAMAAGEVHLK